MNFFDKEERIIFFLQDVSKKEIQFYPKNLKHSRKIKSIINKKGGKIGLILLERANYHQTFIIQKKK